MIIQYRDNDNSLSFRKAVDCTEVNLFFHVELYKFTHTTNKVIQVNDYFDKHRFLNECIQIKGTL